MIAELWPFDSAGLESAIFICSKLGLMTETIRESASRRSNWQALTLQLGPEWRVGRKVGLAIRYGSPRAPATVHHESQQARGNKLRVGSGAGAKLLFPDDLNNVTVWGLLL